MRSSARWTCPPAADPRRSGRGLSLLELLVAIAIVAAIAAAALPWTWSRLNRATLPETADRIVATLRHARAEAMRSGRLVEVRFEPAGEAAFDLGTVGSDRDRLRARYFDPDDFMPEASAMVGMAGDLERELDVPATPSNAAVPSGSAAGFGDPDAIAGSWSVLTIPLELRLRPRTAGSREEFVETVESAEAAPSLDEAFAELADEQGSTDAFESGSPVPQPLAIFLPDGSNVLAASWWLEERPPEDGLPPPELDRRRRVRLDFADAAGLVRRGEVERIVPTMGEVAP